MALIERIKQILSKRIAIDTDKIRDKIPFVQLFGYEKSYGAPHPQDYDAMVKSYKSWAYACAFKNATSLAKNKINLYKRRIVDNEEELDIIAQHPFVDLINKVNPFSNRVELLMITQIFLELTGNAYWWLPKNELGIPYMIWNIPANWVRIVPSKEKFIEGYVVRASNSKDLIPFDESEVVHFKFPSPFDLFYGTGPLLAGAYGMDLNTSMKEWMINFFMNNAQPSGVLYTESSLSPDQYNRLKDTWNQKYRGSKNAGKMAILEAGLKYQQIGSTLKDAKMESITTDVRNEILAMFGVPASKLGLVEDVNRANADANDYTYQKDTILPRMMMIEEKINEKILPIYDTDLIVKFDNPVPEDLDFKLRERELNIRSGFSSIDDERLKEGLDPYDLPETRVPLIPFSLTPAGTPKPEFDINPQDEDKDEQKTMTKGEKALWETFVTATSPQERLFTEVMKRYFQAQKSEIMRKLNNYRSVKATKDLYQNIIFNMTEWDKNLMDRTKSNVRTAIVTGLMLGSQETNHNIDFNLFEPNIARAVEERSSFFAHKINQTTADIIAGQINDGLKNGETISEISKRLDSVMEHSVGFRAPIAARTEVIGATNAGLLTSYQEAGIKFKEWVTAGDEKVRKSHQIKQTVGMTQDFVTGMGSHMKYPGDRSSGAPASDIINCRCRIRAVFK